jgi:uncharacterized membrane protein YeaQ/YmgE (transglycosylase-associated protein family)
MFFFYLNVGLTYLTIGFACAIFFSFVLKKPLLGRFWGALVVGLIGSFLGGLIDQVFAEEIKFLTDFNSVNVIAAFISAMVMIWILSKVSSPK